MFFMQAEKLYDSARNVEYGLMTYSLSIPTQSASFWTPCALYW